MQTARMTTYYTYGNTDYNGLSILHFDTQEEASEYCIDQMKQARAQGFNISNQAIIRIDRHTVRDEFCTLLTQETATTVEIINKNCAEPVIDCSEGEGGN